MAGGSATLERGLEDFGVLAVVVAELELGDVQRQVLGRDFVVAAHDSALEQGPEAFDGVGVDRANDVLPLAVVDDLARVLDQQVIAAVLVGTQERDLLRDSLTDEARQRLAVHLAQRPRHDFAGAAHSARHSGLAGDTATTRRARTTGTTTLVLVPVLGLAPDIGFVALDDAHKLLELLIGHASPDTVAHAPRGLVGAEAEQPVDLQRAHALLAGEHQVDDLKPLAQRLVGVLEDGPDRDREAVAAGIGAGVADPMEVLGPMFHDLGIAAARAADARRPTLLDQVGPTGVLVREQPVEVAERHLVDARLLGFHGVRPVNRRSLRGRAIYSYCGPEQSNGLMDAL